MVTVITLVEIAIDGIGAGLLLALLGTGITLVFGLGEILNLAQGVLAVVAALVALRVINMGLSMPVAFLVGLVGIALVGLAIDKILLESVYRSEGEERIMVGIFVTLGLTLAIEGLLYQVVPYRFSLPPNLPTVRAFGLVILGSSLLYIVVSGIVITALFLFLDRTYLGGAVQTISQDEVGASLCGVDTRRMRTIIFALSAVLAGIAGLLFGVGSNLAAASGFELTIQALIVSIVGGVKDVPGTVAAGILLGLVLAYANFFIGSYLALIAMFVVAMLAIAVRRGDIT